MNIISPEFVERYADKPAPFGFDGLGYIVYRRTYSRPMPDGTRMEEWVDTIARCINGAQKIGAGYTQEEAHRLFDHLFNLRCNFAGRMLWQLGTSTVDRFGGNSLLNCFFVKINKFSSFTFVFENLMLGCGVGFSIRREDVHELPRVKKGVRIKHIPGAKDTDFIVPDSREGWVRLLKLILEAYFVTGKGFTYSTLLVRQAGEPISGFGGTASGPRILVDGMAQICGVLEARSGKKLRSVDALDICNIIGSIVVAGNVRRSAEIALGDPDDVLFLRAKRWDLGNIPNYRAMSNNTIYADEYDHIMETVWDGYGGNGEPYGFFNLPLSQSTGRTGEASQDSCEGTNPCMPAWSLLLTPSGIRPLREVNVGDEIWSENGWTRVVRKQSSGIQPVFAFKTTAGIFYGTKEHQLISHGIKIPAENCTDVDILSGPICGDYGVLDPQDIMDGLVVGDGSVHHASNNLVHLCIGGHDEDYSDSEISHLIGAKRPAVSNGFGYEIVTTITADELSRTFNRDIPSRFVYGSRLRVCGFLRGLYSANGSVVNGRVTLKATSLRVIETAQVMLSAVGIRSYYTTNKPANVKSQNGNYQCKQSYNLNILIDRYSFLHQIGFLQQYKQAKLEKAVERIGFPTKPIKKSYNVVSTKFMGSDEVFDITVDNDSHTYWTGGLNVANCGEISLSDRECCNLSELYLNRIDSVDQMIDCAKLLYKTQKAIAALPFLHEETNKIVHKNMRLGLGVTGVCQSLDKIDWLDQTYCALKEFDKEWSAQRGWPTSIKLTTVKPSGTLSLLGGATPGVHPAYAPYYIRRVRMSSNDRLVKVVRDAGYHVEFALNFDGTKDHDTIVCEFICAAGEGAVLAKDVPAVDQLNLVKEMQAKWSDNAVSVTVYYRPEELPAIKAWMKANYRYNIKSVSFLRHSDHGFRQAPYEEINQAEYFHRLAQIKPISGAIQSQAIEGIECEGGACPIK